jgi:SprT protein
LKNKEKTSFVDSRAEKLQAYCPPGSQELVNSWLKGRKFSLKISRERVSKLGDFRAGTMTQPARISVNNNLHPTEFLITFAHEIAHYDSFTHYGRRKKPHGKEWKQNFRALLTEVIESGILDPEVCDAIIRCYFMKERIASSPCALLKEVVGQDIKREPVVQDIELGQVFELRNGKRFIKGERLRTRYRCKEVSSGKFYTIHPLATVVKF